MEEFLGQKDNGVFVDVGAYDGITYSNTWGLVQRGWRGLAIEPNPATFQMLKKNYCPYLSIAILEAAIGKEDFANITLAAAISTTSQEQAEEYVRCRWSSGQEPTAQVRMFPLNKVLEDFGISPGFDVLSLDVEGTELDVLDTFDVQKWNPKMAIVEAQQYHPIEPLARHAPAIDRYFEQAGYYKIYCDMVNSIYIKK
jgi:FkbM family methyltransferase